MSDAFSRALAFTQNRGAFGNPLQPLHGPTLPIPAGGGSPFLAPPAPAAARPAMNYLSQGVSYGGGGANPAAPAPWMNFTFPSPADDTAAALDEAVKIDKIAEDVFVNGQGDGGGDGEGGTGDTGGANGDGGHSDSDGVGGDGSQSDDTGPYHSGGIIDDGDQRKGEEVSATVLEGEGVIVPQAVKMLGGAKGVNRLNRIAEAMAAPNKSAKGAQSRRR